MFGVEPEVKSFVGNGRCDPCLIEVAYGGVVAGYVVAPAETDVVLCHHAALEISVLPVGIGLAICLGRTLVDGPVDPGVHKSRYIGTSVGYGIFLELLRVQQ